VREWLAASGSLPTIQARLRADLYAAIQEQASDPTLRLKPKVGKVAVDVPTRCLNWLVGQHLTSQRCWLTTSLMASEAEFPEFGPPRAAIEGMVGERGKQYCTETLSKEKLEQLLRALNLPDEAVESVTQAYFSSPKISLLSLLLDSFSNFKSTSSNGVRSATVPLPEQDDGVEAKLSRIEGKYEKILQQVEERRRGVVKSLLGETSALDKEETASDLDLVNLNKELKRKEEPIKRERRKEEKEARRREKLLRRQESLDTSSSTVTMGSVVESEAGGEMRKQSKVQEKDKTIQKLCQKLEEFLLSQEKEREQSLALAKRLALAEEELKHFQEKEKDWEEEKRKGDESEDIARMTQLVSQQMSKLAEQAKLIQDLRVQVEVGKVERKVNEQEEKVIDQQEKTISPTEDFLRQMKERVEELSREQMEIDDEFEDFNQTSLKE